MYVAHIWSGGPKQGKTNVVVFKNNNGFLEFYNWIELDKPTSPTDGRKDYAEFQAINPWDGMFYTCFGGGPDTIHEFFMHDPESVNIPEKRLNLIFPLPMLTALAFLLMDISTLLPTQNFLGMTNIKQYGTTLL